MNVKIAAKAQVPAPADAPRRRPAGESHADPFELHLQAASDEASEKLSPRATPLHPAGPNKLAARPVKRRKSASDKHEDPHVNAPGAPASEAPEAEAETTALEASVDPSKAPAEVTPTDAAPTASEASAAASQLAAANAPAQVVLPETPLPPEVPLEQEQPKLKQPEPRKREGVEFGKSDLKADPASNKPEKPLVATFPKQGRPDLSGDSVKQPSAQPDAKDQQPAAETKEDRHAKPAANAAPALQAPAITDAAALADAGAAAPKPLTAEVDRRPAALQPAPALHALSGDESTSPVPTNEGAKSASAAQDSPAPTADQTYDQVVLGLRTKMDAANQKAELQLNPPNLGRLHVSVEVSNGLLTARFRASSDVVRDLLSSRMDHLRSVLEGQGIAVDKLAVGSVQQPSSTSQVSPGNASTGDQHDGRSGGTVAQDRQPSRQGGGDGFAGVWRAALAKEEPIDLLA